MKKYFVIAILLLFVYSCSDSLADIAEIDDLKIQAYLSEHGLEATKTESGLYYIIETPGNSEHPDIYTRLLVNYKGYFLDGTVFDDYTTGINTVYLFALMKGWQEGVPMLGKGGKGTFFIRSGLGLGDKEDLQIPKNSVLIYEIELIDF